MATGAPDDSLIDLRNLRGGTTAQAGENAIFDRIFETIGTTNKFCVDCGAFDLTHLSNVKPLWKESGAGRRSSSKEIHSQLADGTDLPEDEDRR